MSGGESGPVEPARRRAFRVFQPVPVAPTPDRRARGVRSCTMGIIIGLLILWLVFTFLGFLVKGLVWLAIIGIVLLVATVAYGFVKGLFKSSSR